MNFEDGNAIGQALSKTGRFSLELGQYSQSEWTVVSSIHVVSELSVFMDVLRPHTAPSYAIENRAPRVNTAMLWWWITLACARI